MKSIDYAAALKLQRQQLEPLLCFSPTAVVTAGKNVKPAERNRVQETLSRIGVPLLPTERGGQFTFHHPGQLILFPSINLIGKGIGPRSFVERSLGAVAAVLTDLELPNQVRLDQAGVWAERSKRKICSIGLKIERGVPYHGLSLNVLAPDPALAKAVYNLVDICGLSGECITSIEEEMGNSPDLDQVKRLVLSRWAEEFGG